jgi:hypothetical protein
MSETTLKESEMETKTSKLDVFHKAIYPTTVILLGIATFVWLNYDKQRQITELQEGQKALAARFETANNHQLAQRAQLEENLQTLRTAYCGAFALSGKIDSDSPQVAKFKRDFAAAFALQMVMFQDDEAKVYGDEEAKKLWEKARKSAGME